jgi:opacity protein-like surface antigen
MMRSLFTVIVALAFSTQVFAADYLPPPPVPAPVAVPAVVPFDGCYGGIGVGLSVASNSATVKDNQFFYPYETYNISDLTSTSTSPSLGIQLGCNFLFGNVLTGIEFDSWANYFHGEVCKTNSDPFSHCLDWNNYYQGTLSTRVGYVWNNLLIYSKVGASYLPIKYHYGANAVSYEQTVLPTDPTKTTPTWATNFLADKNNNTFAPTLGFGVEYAFAPGLTLRTELAGTFVPFNSQIAISSIHYDSPSYITKDGFSYQHDHPYIGGIIPTNNLFIDTSLRMSVVRFF